MIETTIVNMQKLNMLGVGSGGALAQTSTCSSSKSRSVGLGGGLNSVMPFFRRATFALPNAKTISN
jgi:hypothetical protein